MKIGIFGTTADPFTDAHESIVKKVLDEKLVDKVIVVPTVVDYYRNQDDKWLTDDERMSVIKSRVYELKIYGYNVEWRFTEIECKPLFQPLTLKTKELWRKGRRYYHTLYDVIQYVEYEAPNSEYYTIIGTDQYKNFKSWFMWKELLDLTKLIVVNGRCGDTLGETVGYHDDVPCIEVTIDQKFMFTSATAIRREYKGTEDAVNRYINRQPPLREKLLQHTPIFDLVEKPEVQPGFRPVGINAPDWVTVVIRHGDDYMYVRQLRYGTMMEYTEFVCGQVEKGEEPADAAKREVKEETGVTSIGNFVFLGTYATNPAFMNNYMHFYLAELTEADLRSSMKPMPDEHEKLQIQWAKGYIEHDLDKGPAFRRLAVELVKNYDNAKKGN